MTRVYTPLAIVAVLRALFAETAGSIGSDRHHAWSARFAKTLRRIDVRSRSRHERRKLEDRTPAGRSVTAIQWVLQAAIPVAFERRRLAQELPVSSERGKPFPWLENVR